MEELPGKLSVSQTTAMNQINLAGDKLDLVEQILECPGREQNLSLTKGIDFPRRFLSTDASLVTTETTKQALQM